MEQKQKNSGLLATIKRAGPSFLALVCFLIAFSPISLKLFAEWTREEYSHGFLIPFLAGLMLWHRIKDIPTNKREPSAIGLLWVIVSLLMLLVSDLSTFRQLGFLALVFLSVGLSLLFLGRTATKEATPAFILLLFAIPLPFMIHNNLSFHLKTISSGLGVTLLEIIGVSVYREGNIIDLGSYKLQVVDACNGLRYLFPAASFSYLIAYILKDAMWKRVVIFLSSIPLTIGLNALRIAVVGVTVNVWGTQAAEGFTHIFEGYFVFLLCVILLMAETFALLRLGKKGRIDWDFFTLPHTLIKPKPLEKKLGFAVLALALLAGGYTLSTLNNPKATSGQISIPHLNSFPLSFNKWQGSLQNINPTILKDLTLSDYLLADYSQPKDTASVNLYIAYYARQEIGSAAHSPETCVPGSGWKIETTQEIILPNIRRAGSTFHVVRMLISLGNNRQIVYYWFEGRGRAITSQIAAKWYLMIDSLTMGRTDGGLIRVTTSLTPFETEAAADRRLTTFLSDAYPLIEKRMSP